MEWENWILWLVELEMSDYWTPFWVCSDFKGKVKKIKSVGLHGWKRYCEVHDKANHLDFPVFTVGRSTSEGVTVMFESWVSVLRKCSGEISWTVPTLVWKFFDASHEPVRSPLGFDLFLAYAWRTLVRGSVLGFLSKVEECSRIMKMDSEHDKHLKLTKGTQED